MQGTYRIRHQNGKKECANSQTADQDFLTTSGISSPLAAQSVATSTGIWPLTN